MEVRRVLVVEDNAETRDWLCACVREAYDEPFIHLSPDVADANIVSLTPTQRARIEGTQRPTKAP